MFLIRRIGLKFENWFFWSIKNSKLHFILNERCGSKATQTWFRDLDEPCDDGVLFEILFDFFLLLLDDHGQVPSVTKLHDDQDPLRVEAFLDNVSPGISSDNVLVLIMV